MCAEHAAWQGVEQICFENQGKHVTFKDGLTQVTLARNGTLRSVVQEISKDERFEGNVVKRKASKDERGVTADGIYVFEQGAFGPGKFKPPYSDFKLPDRRGRRR